MAENKNAPAADTSPLDFGRMLEALNPISAANAADTQPPVTAPLRHIEAKAAAPSVKAAHVESHILYKVRGSAEGYDTAEAIVNAWWKANPDKHAAWHNNKSAFYNSFLDLNGLSPKSTHSPCGERIDNVVILYAGKSVKLPEGKMIPPVLAHGRECKVPEAVIAAATVTPPPPPESVTLTAAEAPLPQWVSGGGAGQQDIQGNGRTTAVSAYDHLNYALIHGELPPLPHVAARGDNPNDPRTQTIGDALRRITDMSITPGLAAGTMALGGPVAGTTLQTGSGGDRAEHWMVAQEGSPRRNDPFINVSGQWPFTGKVNPFVPSDHERKLATHLPGWYGIDQQTGQIISADKDFAFLPGTNPLYTVANEAPAITSNKTGVNSGHKKENDRLSGTPSAPQTLWGATNYAMSYETNRLSIVPKLNALAASYEQEADASKKAELAQRIVDHFNYQSSLVFIAADPVKRLETEKARDSFIAKAEAAGVQDIKRFHMMADTPDTTVTKEKMRETLQAYYTNMASSDVIVERAAFGLVKHSYRDEFVGIYNTLVKEGNIADPAKQDLSSDDLKKDTQLLETVVAQTVEALPLMKTMPEKGTTLPNVDRFVSVRDPNHPDDVRHNNYNRVEKGELNPTTAPVDKAAAMTAGMQLIAADNAMTQHLLKGAATDYHIAETLIQRDRLSLDLPREFGEEHDVRFSREHAAEQIAKHGYSDASLKDIFGITRDASGKLDWDGNSGAGQIGNWNAPISKETLVRAQQEIAARADDLAQVFETRQALAPIATDGSPNPIFAAGDLQTRLLYALATERGNTTLTKMEARLREQYPEQADARIQTLRQAIHAATDVGMKQRVGVSRSEQEEYVNAQRVALAEKEAGKEATVTEDGKVTITADAPGARIPDHVKAAIAASGAMAAGGAAGNSTITNTATMDVAKIVAAVNSPQATAAAFMQNTETSPIALHAIATTSPELMQAAVINTALSSPSMAKGIANVLKKEGVARNGGVISNIFEHNSHSELATILTGLADAQAGLTSTDQEISAKAKANADKFTAQLQQFSKADPNSPDGQKNIQALADLNTLLLTGQAYGTAPLAHADLYRASLISTLLATMNPANTGDKNPLANFGMPQEQIANAANGITSAIVNAPAVYAETLANAGKTVATSAYTISGSFQGIPLIVFPNPLYHPNGGTPDNPSTHPGTPGDCPGICETVPPGASIPPPLPTPPVPTPPSVPTPGG